MKDKYNNCKKIEKQMIFNYDQLCQNSWEKNVEDKAVEYKISSNPAETNSEFSFLLPKKLKEKKDIQYIKLIILTFILTLPYTIYGFFRYVYKTGLAHIKYDYANILVPTRTKKQKNFSIINTCYCYIMGTVSCFALYITLMYMQVDKYPRMRDMSFYEKISACAMNLFGSVNFFGFLVVLCAFIKLNFYVIEKIRDRYIAQFVEGEKNPIYKNYKILCFNFKICTRFKAYGMDGINTRVRPMEVSRYYFNPYLNKSAIRYINPYLYSMYLRMYGYYVPVTILKDDRDPFALIDYSKYKRDNSMKIQKGSYKEMKELECFNPYVFNDYSNSYLRYSLSQSEIYLTPADIERLEKKEKEEKKKKQKKH